MSSSEPIQAISPIDPQIQKKNFQRVEIDAVGIGLANAASPFLPVFLTRSDATNVQIGLLSSMPAVTGFFLSILVGRFLQTRRKIVPWFSFARLLVVSSYALTGLIPFFIPKQYIVPAVLLVWALATIPQTMVAVAFSVVMNAVAGPQGRYALMSARWSILGITTAITVAGAGQLLKRLDFPVNYQILFLGLSVGGLISYYFSSRIVLPETDTPSQTRTHSLRETVRNYYQLVHSEPAFISFTLKRLVFISGVSLGAPLFPLYFVRVIQASDQSISFISTAQTFIMVIGYFIWTRLSRSISSRFVLLATTGAMAIYPALVAVTQRVDIIILYAALAGLFQAGLDLVFFDELMKTVPASYSATFVSLAQSLQYFSAIFAPLIGTFLADHIGISGALLISTIVRIAGFLLFIGKNPHKPPQEGQIPVTDKV